jgi:hypothetical protein
MTPAIVRCPDPQIPLSIVDFLLPGTTRSGVRDEARGQFSTTAGEYHVLLN